MECQAAFNTERRRYKAEVLRNYALKGGADAFYSFVEEIEAKAAVQERRRVYRQIAKVTAIVVIWIIGSALVAQWMRPYSRIVEWMTS